MEPNNNRAEAQRWLSIAEKLLTTRDLIGSKTFAIRARESDPRLEIADQILAVADALLAGDSGINNNNQQPDWYGVLQLVRRTRDTDLIATQYRRLALLLNPNRNKLPFADQAFKLVLDAWSVLSNPSKKALYDNELTQVDSGRSSQTQQQQSVREESTRNVKEKTVATDEGFQEEYPSSNESTRASFWTACPYCYNLYEYPKVYEDCTLRCQNCRRAFHAVTIPSPPEAESGKDAYFCCWGYFPLGISVNELEKAQEKGSSYNWTPFSPMFNCPSQNNNKNVPNVKAPKSARPKAIIIDDDEDVLMEVSDPSDGSDDDWGSNRKKKKGKNAKGKSPAKKSVEKFKKGNQNVTGRTRGKGVENLQGGSGLQDGLGVGNATIGETSKKAVMGNSSKKHMGKHGNELGKLDLNVEFSNEVEEPVSGLSTRNGTGNGEEDNIEGIGFFEGLDEFLSSLPILSVVGGDDKGKAST